MMANQTAQKIFKQNKKKKVLLTKVGLYKRDSCVPTRKEPSQSAFQKKINFLKLNIKKVFIKMLL